MDDYEVVAQELSVLGDKMREIDNRLAEVERVNARLEDAALTTARAMAEISNHWDAVYEAMRRARQRGGSTASHVVENERPGGSRGTKLYPSEVT